MVSDKLIKECSGFDWDKGNEDKNEKKHGVSKYECESVFLEDPYVVDDNLHSLKEKRMVAFGETINGRFLSIFFTIRGNKIRVISARDQSKKERIIYLKMKKDE